MLGESTGAADWPPRFTLDQEPVLRLFIGEGFYSSADASLREAILNAVDACGRRRSVEAAVSPQIRVVFDESSRVVTIEDNGDGMTQNDVVALFTKVGASSSHLAGMPDAQRYKAVGTFGIGVVSYFLVCDEFEVHTMGSDDTCTALLFSQAMLDGRTPAVELAPERSETGTTVRLRVKDDRLFNLLLEKFPFWARDVLGLSAISLPTGAEVLQGGLSREVEVLDVTLPEWIEAAHVGPPTEFSVWDASDGRAKVDVLYRGVHVDRLESAGLWGIEGAIHVDPRHFRPKLNREGFVGQEMRGEVETFLRAAHPAAVMAALPLLRNELAKPGTDGWSMARWAAIWLAIPRTAGYEEATQAWDHEFETRPVFRVLGASESDEQPISISDLIARSPSEVFIAPNLGSASAVLRQAVRALRARGQTVIQGIERDGSFLAHATWAAASTADLLLSAFRDKLPPVARIDDAMAQGLVQQESIIAVYAASPRVLLVHLGNDAVPIVRIGSEIWVNVDVDAGRRLIVEICDRNEGTLGLWVACLLHCPDQTGEIAPVVRQPSTSPRLGPVLRQHLRSLVS